MAGSEALTVEVEQTLRGPFPDVEVVDLRLDAQRGSVQLVIDHPHGVDLELCERVTRALDELRRRYALEVSSPGLDRPLTKVAHFARAVGEQVRIELREPLDGRRRFVGALVRVDGEEATVRLEDGDEIALHIPRVKRANVVWTPVKP